MSNKINGTLYIGVTSDLVQRVWQHKNGFVSGFTKKYGLKYQEQVKNSKIKLVFLPTYSPELNLIERLWKVFTKHVLKNRFYEKFDAFIKACFGFFKNQNRYRDEIESIMGSGLEGLT